jgi:hypothetical protein
MKNLLLILIMLGIGGYLYYAHISTVADITKNVNTTKDTVVTATKADVDAIVKSGLGSVSTISPGYYLQNRNYGVSATENICNNATSSISIGNVIATIQKYTKGVSCVADPDYPSRSFTFVAPSLVNPGKEYCTDQSGVVSLISSSLSQNSFREGVKCK